MVLCGLFLSALFKLVWSQQCIPQGAGKRTTCLLPLRPPSQPSPGEEDQGRRERRDESWDVMAGSNFRGHCVQHLISQIRKIRFREFNAQAMRITRDPWWGQPFRGTRQILVPLPSSAHLVPCIWGVVMPPHSSALAWRIPWTEEPGGLQSMGSLGVRHDWATSLSLSLFTFMHWRRKWQPTPVFLPRESQGRGSLVGCCLWGRTELDTTEVT